MAIVATSMLYAQNETVVIENPEKVTIVTGQNTQSVYVQGSKDNPDAVYYRAVEAPKNGSSFEKSGPIGGLDFNLPFVKKETVNRNSKVGRTYASTYGGLFPYFGFMMQQESPYKFSPWASYEYGAKILDYEYKGKVFGISAGLGLGWKDFMSRNDVMYHKGADGIEVGPVMQSFDVKKSVFRVASVIAPVNVGFFWRVAELGFSVGPVLNFNYHSKIKNKYSINGGSVQKVKEKDLNVAPLTVDWQASLCVGGDISFYVKYSPNNYFDSASAPALNNVMHIGIKTNLW